MEAREYKTLLVASDGGVATVTLNRPERRNAIGTQMVNELVWALDDARDDESVRSVVLTGAGNSFCAGGDFQQMTAGSEAGELPFKGDYKDLLLRLWRGDKPTIARVNGHAMGGGLGLVAACTFAVAASDAKLGTPEIKVGLFPFMIMALLERLMGRRALVEMMLSGKHMSGDEAARLGLVNKAVPAAELDAAVAEYTTMLGQKSPNTLRLGLTALRDTEEMTLDEKLPVLEQRLHECLATDDAREGLMAFLQKREPSWTGR
ncbi:MAG: enoyl-CoA hydratase/isomerase family protein [Myxococcales bacterium]|nr:enoyl-CoA hydratase/isomerase family protein [Myxococcales bacterium]